MLSNSPQNTDVVGLFINRMRGAIQFNLKPPFVLVAFLYLGFGAENDLKPGKAKTIKAGKAGKAKNLADISLFKRSFKY